MMIMLDVVRWISCYFMSDLQIVLLPRNYSLYFKALVYEDTGMYICLVNDRHSPEKVIDLLVHGKIDHRQVHFVGFTYYLFWVLSQMFRQRLVDH